jgi:hypothetical protein
MQLDYLDFDFSDEDSGRGAFDAMASVLPERLPALLAELAIVFRWAIDAFGPSDALDAEGDWDYALHGVIEPDLPLKLEYDAAAGRVIATPASSAARRTLTLTLSGSAAFCDAFRETFGVDA